MSTKMTSQLRFPEFTDEWQVKKLGDFSSITTGKLDANAMVEGGRYRFYTCAREFYRIDHYAFDTEALLVSGNGANVGYIHYYNGKFNAYQRTYVLNNFEENIGYIKLYLDRYLKKRILQEKFEGNMPYIVLSTLKDMSISIPPLKEQEKIADFLTAVDERIAVGEKKLELLETYKRGVMQKIFSQQIRFKDEDGNPYPEWEEKKISDVLKERNMQMPINGEYPLMAFVAYKGVAPKGDRYNREFLVSDAKSKKYKQTQLGDFIYSSNNLETGSIGLNLYGSASISPVYSIFETKDGYSHQFLGAYLTRKKFIYQMVRYRQGVVYGQWRIHESEFLKIEETFPCTEEQQKIANFLTTLDEKITAEKSKLTAAKKFKKALLQRMFV